MSLDVHKMQRLRCNGCVVKANCEKFTEGAVCWYDTHEAPDLGTASGIIQAIKDKVESEYFRYRHTIIQMATSGCFTPDKEVTTLSAALSKDLATLAELSVRFGLIKEKVPHDKLPQQPIQHINAEQVNILQITKDELEECQILKAQLEDLKQQQALLTS